MDDRLLQYFIDPRTSKILLDIVRENRITVKRLCEKKGTNFCAVEKACGIGNGVLGKFSDGDRDPSVKTLKKLSKYFNVPMDKLLK